MAVAARNTLDEFAPSLLAGDAGPFAMVVKPPAPVVTVSDPAITQAAGTAAALTFTFTLSAASARTVLVYYYTTDGSAHQNADYKPTAGVIAFAPGQLTATLTVRTHPSAVGSANFGLVLGSPQGAVLASTRATGTVTAVPVVTVQGTLVDVAAAVAPPATGTRLSAGYLSTSGNQIVDQYGNPVRLNAVNWYGLETPDFAPHGLWAANYQTMMDQMVSLGFNAIRLPFSDQLFDAGSVPGTINFYLNPDLAGLNGLGIMDKIVAYAGKIGLKVILDHHRSDAGFGGPNENGLWYQGAYDQARFLADWTMLAKHYAGNATVIGADLANEPHGAATWGDGGPNDWAAAATQAGDAIQAINPNWLMIVEGVEQYDNNWTWWGGNLMGVKDHPIVLTDPNKVVYSPHDYPQSITDLPQFSAPNYPNNLPAIWNHFWGYINTGNIAPVWIGEFGSELLTTNDQQWMNTLISYMDGGLQAAGGPTVSAGHLGVSWSYWAWNADTGVTAGILGPDWSTPNANVLAAIKPAMNVAAITPSVGVGPGAGAAALQFTVHLSAASAQAVTVRYATQDATAHAGVDYVPTSGTLTFAPGETVRTISASLLSDAAASGQRDFLLDLSAPVNAALGTSAAATATLITAGASVRTSAPGPGPTQATVTISNTGAAAVSGWQVQLTTADVLGTVTGATLLSHAGTTYVYGSLPATASLGAHGTASFAVAANDAAGGTPIAAQVIRLGA